MAMVRVAPFFDSQCISVRELYMLRTASVQTSRPELLPSQLSTLPDVSWALLLHTTAQMSTRTTEFCTCQLLQGGKLLLVNMSQGVSSVLMAHLCQADDISDLLSPAASLSPGQGPLWAVGTLQSLEPKYGTVCLQTYDSSLSHCVHSDIN